jgi:hypothetical protein
MTQLQTQTRNLPLRLVLVVPFVLQIFMAVGIVGYLSFRHGQRAVNDLAAQLMLETSQRVDQHLDSYLVSTHKLLETDFHIIQQKLIDPQDFTRLSRLFWQQIHSFKVSFINYGTVAGDYAGAGWMSEDHQGLGNKSCIHGFYD